MEISIKSTAITKHTLLTANRELPLRVKVFHKACITVVKHSVMHSVNCKAQCKVHLATVKYSVMHSVNCNAHFTTVMHAGLSYCMKAKTIVCSRPFTSWLLSRSLSSFKTIHQLTSFKNIYKFSSFKTIGFFQDHS